MRLRWSPGPSAPSPAGLGASRLRASGLGASRLGASGLRASRLGAGRGAALGGSVGLRDTVDHRDGIAHPRQVSGLAGRVLAVRRWRLRAERAAEGLVDLRDDRHRLLDHLVPFEDELGDERVDDALPVLVERHVAVRRFERHRRQCLTERRVTIGQVASDRFEGLHHRQPGDVVAVHEAEPGGS